MLIHHVEPSIQDVAAAGRRAPAYAWLVFGLTVGLLRAERALHRPADARAALADPLLPPELARVLRRERAVP